MSDERMRHQRESAANIRPRAEREAEASPKAAATLELYGKTEMAQVFDEIVRLTKDRLSRGLDADEERQSLRTSLMNCGVTWGTAALFTQAFFREREAAQPKDTSFKGKVKELIGHAKAVFKNEG